MFSCCMKDGSFMPSAALLAIGAIPQVFVHWKVLGPDNQLIHSSRRVSIQRSQAEVEMRSEATWRIMGLSK